MVFFLYYGCRSAALSLIRDVRNLLPLAISLTTAPEPARDLVVGSCSLPLRRIGFSACGWGVSCDFFLFCSSTFAISDCWQLGVFTRWFLGQWLTLFILVGFLAFSNRWQSGGWFLVLLFTPCMLPSLIVGIVNWVLLAMVLSCDLWLWLGFLIRLSRLGLWCFVIRFTWLRLWCFVMMVVVGCHCDYD